MDDFIIRRAEISDIPFLAKTIIEAEKSGTDILSYSTVFGLSESAVEQYLGEMLSLEAEDCEISLSSFLVAQSGKTVVGATSGWVEAREGIPSGIIKGNLINYVFPKQAVERAVQVYKIISELNIDYTPGSVVLAAGYVVPQYRGNAIMSQLIRELITYLLDSYPEVKELSAQIYASNTPSIISVEKLGFKEVCRKESSNEAILKYLPSNMKLLFTKKIKS